MFHRFLVITLLWGVMAQWYRARHTSERLRVRTPAALNMLRHCAPRQGTLLTHALSQPRSKWVPGRTVKACVFEWICVPKMAAGLYAPRGIEMAYE